MEKARERQRGQKEEGRYKRERREGKDRLDKQGRQRRDVGKARERQTGGSEKRTGGRVCGSAALRRSNGGISDP